MIQNPGMLILPAIRIFRQTDTATSMFQKNYLIIAVVSVVLVVVLSIWTLSSHDLEPQSTEKDDSAARAGRVEQRESILIETDPESSQDADGSDPDEDNERRGQPDVTSYFSPEKRNETDSPELSAWKERSYIPEPEEMDRYLLDMDLEELRLHAQNGDVFAQSALGNRLVRKQLNAKQGIDWLIEAASYGSQEALQQLRWIYQFGAGPIAKDQFAFLAWSKVAFMLGDWQAMFPWEKTIDIGVEELALVNVMAANFFSEINARHFERSGRNMEIRLRPGYREAMGQFLNISQNEGAR